MLDEQKFSIKSKIKALKLLSREKLTNILSKVPGKKDLIIDPKIIKPLQNIISVSILKSFDVEKIYKIDSSDILSTSETRVFLIYTNLVLVKYVCDHINSEVAKGLKMPKFYIILVPRKLSSVLQLLEEDGVYEYVTVFSLQWELIPLDNDSILSLELSTFFSNLFVNEDQSFLPVVAKSIWSSLHIWGSPATRICLGTHSQYVSDMVDKYLSLLGAPENAESSLDCLIIVDRDIDYMSTLLTPTTYTSLLDEVFGIQSGFVELNEGLVIPLNSQDIYLQIKNRHFSHVIPYLKEVAKTIQADHEKSMKMNIEQVKEFVKKNLVNITEQKKSLSHHITACEMIMKRLGDHFDKFVAAEENILANTSRSDTINFIEDCLAMNFADKFSVLKLICLLSFTQNGLSAEDASRLKTQYLNAYGYKYLPLFYNLEKLGLFVAQPGFNLTEVSATTLANKVAQVVPLPSRKSRVHQMIQNLKLTPSQEDQSNFKDPSDMSYVFSGSYIPAVCQLVNLLKDGKITKDDILKFLPNSRVENLKENPKINRFFVYFVGGITYAEAAAFQLVEKLSGCEILIGTTNIINSHEICKSCC